MRLLPKVLRTWYTKDLGGSKKKNQDQPSYELGELRDKKIERKQKADFQWHSGPQNEPDDFYAGDDSSTETNTRDVMLVGSPSVGQTLCRNGAVSHKDCQEVRALNVCNGNACNLVEMGAHLSAGGDSGGPVYMGYAAYGLHQGWVYDPYWPFDREVFSRADRIDDALGVYIATD